MARKTNQRLHSLSVSQLKNLKNLDFSFEDKAVTAILGPNGNGKSTILHALACAFSPVDQNVGENYRFSNFFLPSTDALWAGSKMQVTHSYQDGTNSQGDPIIKEDQDDYTKVSDRWAPRYDRRPSRNVFYIGVDKCVPLIESEKRQSRINYETEEINENVINQILQEASSILNKNYVKYNSHTAAGKKFIGVEVEGLRYSALSMSAGEQKVFYILERVFKAPKVKQVFFCKLSKKFTG